MLNLIDGNVFTAENLKALDNLYDFYELRLPSENCKNGERWNYKFEKSLLHKEYFGGSIRSVVLSRKGEWRCVIMLPEKRAQVDFRQYSDKAVCTPIKPEKIQRAELMQLLVNGICYSGQNNVGGHLYRLLPEKRDKNPEMIVTLEISFTMDDMDKNNIRMDFPAVRTFTRADMLTDEKYKNKPRFTLNLSSGCMDVNFDDKTKKAKYILANPSNTKNTVKFMELVNRYSYEKSKLYVLLKDVPACFDSCYEAVGIKFPRELMQTFAGRTWTRQDDKSWKEIKQVGKKEKAYQNNFIAQNNFTITNTTNATDDEVSWVKRFFKEAFEKEKIEIEITDGWKEGQQNIELVPDPVMDKKGKDISGYVYDDKFYQHLTYSTIKNAIEEAKKSSFTTGKSIAKMVIRELQIKDDIKKNKVSIMDIDKDIYIGKSYKFGDEKRVLAAKFCKNGSIQFLTSSDSDSRPLWDEIYLHTADSAFKLAIQIDGRVGSILDTPYFSLPDDWDEPFAQLNPYEKYERSLFGKDFSAYAENFIKSKDMAEKELDLLRERCLSFTEIISKNDKSSFTLKDLKKVLKDVEDNIGNTLGKKMFRGQVIDGYLKSRGLRGIVAHVKDKENVEKLFALMTEISWTEMKNGEQLFAVGFTERGLQNFTTAVHIRKLAGDIVLDEILPYFTSSWLYIGETIRYSHFPCLKKYLDEYYYMLSRKVIDGEND